MNPMFFSKFSTRHFLFLLIPLTLSAFTHLWYPAASPSLAYDEGEYMRRALNILNGQGPQATTLYDHPYFGPLVLAGILRIIDFPSSLNLSADGNPSSIESAWLVPRTLMGLFAIIDTFLVFKLAERIYNNNIAFIASILFAVMPITMFTRWILLDSILLPFFLTSILLATYGTKKKGTTDNESRSGKNIINSNQGTNLVAVTLSGIFLGLAIFTKIPVFIMIPLIAYLIFTNNGPKRFKALVIWFIPVILIPLTWPAYAVSVGQLGYWLDGIYYQTNREIQHLFVALIDVVVIDPLILALSTAGLIFAGIKKDVFLILWIIPFLIFLLIIGYVNSWYLIPLLPACCIAIARLIVGLTKKIRSTRAQQTLPFVVVSAIGIFGLINTTLSITMDSNSGAFEATALVAQYLKNNNDNDNNKITVISNPNSFWIYRDIFNLDYNEKDYSEYPNETSVKTSNVVLIADPAFMYFLSRGYDPLPELQDRIQKMYHLYATERASVFKTHSMGDQISIYINK